MHWFQDRLISQVWCQSPDGFHRQNNCNWFMKRLVFVFVCMVCSDNIRRYSQKEWKTPLDSSSLTLDQIVDPSWPFIHSFIHSIYQVKVSALPFWCFNMISAIIDCIRSNEWTNKFFHLYRSLLLLFFYCYVSQHVQFLDRSSSNKLNTSVLDKDKQRCLLQIVDVFIDWLTDWEKEAVQL